MTRPDIEHQSLSRETAPTTPSIANPTTYPGELITDPEIIAQLPPAEILKSGIRIIRSEIIPVSRIVQDDSIIDVHHAESLALDFQTEWKQTSPINVRARLVEHEDGGEDVVYDISDGYHRAYALKLLDWETARAEVTYNATDAELYHHRMLAANSVASVQFARTPIWLQQAFRATKWGQQGMRATQAFAIAMNDSQRAQNLRIPPDEIREIKEWVKGNCKTLKKPVSTTYLNLLLVENADPELAVKVREREGGEAAIGNVTPGRLKAIVNVFPGEENYAAQNAVMQHVRELKLNDPITVQMAKYLRDNNIITPNMTAAEAYGVIASWLTTVDISTMFRVEKTESASSRLRMAQGKMKELRESNTALAASLRELQNSTLPQVREENDRLRQENAALRGDGRQTAQEAAALQEKIGSLEKRIVGLQRENADLTRQNIGLKNQSATLRNENDRLNQEVRNSRRNKDKGASSEVPTYENEPWYRTDSRVSNWERRAVDAMLQGDVSLEEFARKNGKTVNDVVWAVRGVLDLRATGNRQQRVQRPIKTPQKGEQNDTSNKDGRTNAPLQAHVDTPIAVYQAAKKPAPPSGNGKAEPVARTEQENATSADQHALVLAGFFERNTKAISSLGLTPPGEDMTESLYEFADGNGIVIDIDKAPLEAQRVKALRFAQEKLVLPADDFAKFQESLPSAIRNLFSYVDYLRKGGILVNLIQIAVEDQRQFYERHRGNIGPKTTSAA